MRRQHGLPRSDSHLQHHRADSKPLRAVRDGCRMQDRWRQPNLLPANGYLRVALGAKLDLERERSHAEAHDFQVVGERHELDRVIAHTAALPGDDLDRRRPRSYLEQTGGPMGSVRLAWQHARADVAREQITGQPADFTDGKRCEQGALR